MLARDIEQRNRSGALRNGKIAGVRHGESQVLPAVVNKEHATTTPGSETVAKRGELYDFVERGSRRASRCRQRPENHLPQNCDYSRATLGAGREVS
jgi:hypothetical protein